MAIRSLTPGLNHWHINKTSISHTQNLYVFSQKKLKLFLRLFQYLLLTYIYGYSDEPGTKFSSASWHFHYFSHFSLFIVLPFSIVHSEDIITAI
jgi:hypothetical protein